MSSSAASSEIMPAAARTNNKSSENHLSNINPLKEFHLFAELPFEISRKIWGFATPPPWLIMCKTSFWPIVERDAAPYTREVRAVLRACKESREEFLYDEKIRKDHPTFQYVYGLATKNNGAVFISTEQDVVLIVSEGKFPLLMADNGLLVFWTNAGRRSLQFKTT
jgi:hypothetical protein